MTFSMFCVHFLLLPEITVPTHLFVFQNEPAIEPIIVYIDQGGSPPCIDKLLKLSLHMCTNIIHTYIVYIHVHDVQILSEI